MALEDQLPNVCLKDDQCIARRHAVQQICAIARKYADELFPDEPGDANYARQLAGELENASRKRGFAAGPSQPSLI